MKGFMFAAVAALAFAVPAGAQGAPSGTSATAADAGIAAATLWGPKAATSSMLIRSTALSPAPRAELAAAQDTVYVQQRRSRNGALAMLVAGGAAMLVGLAANQDVLTVVGAGVTGIGLYLYLR
jgi:hypothetical protein